MRQKNKIPNNNCKRPKRRPPSLDVLAIYRSLKLRRLFGWFMTSSMPLRDVGQLEESQIMRGTQKFVIRKNLIYGNRESKLYSYIRHIIAIVLASNNRKGKYISFDTVNHIVQPRIYDYVITNKASDKIYPCVLTYEFLWGTVFAVFGIVLMYVLMLCLLPIDPLAFLVPMWMILTFFMFD